MRQRSPDEALERSCENLGVAVSRTVYSVRAVEEEPFWWLCLAASTWRETAWFLPTITTPLVPGRLLRGLREGEDVRWVGSGGERQVLSDQVTRWLGGGVQVKQSSTA